MNYHAWLAHFPKITYSRYTRLKGYFLNLENLYTAELDELIQAGLEENIAVEFLTWRDKNPTEKILARLQTEDIKTISLDENGYPPLLAQINDPPHTIFVRGSLPPADKPTLAVVGTRRFTTYGQLCCEDLTAPLAARGVAIVSGLALGIDGIAHNAALDSDGITVAVLGSGINNKVIFPPTHRPLAQKIIDKGGAIISEYPFDFAPTKYSFPARNRIIAGLSLGTLIIEAPIKSGAMITARHALDYNREVMCVPHAITSPTGAGPNHLIKFGARVITEPADILEALNLGEIKQATPVKKENLDKNTPEGKILHCLNKEPKNINEIILETKIDSATMSATLAIMEIKGLIKNTGGMNYIKK